MEKRNRERLCLVFPSEKDEVGVQTSEAVDTRPDPTPLIAWNCAQATYSHYRSNHVSKFNIAFREFIAMHLMQLSAPIKSGII